MVKATTVLEGCHGQVGGFLVPAVALLLIFFALL